MNEESTTQMLLLLLFTALAVFDGDGTVAQVTPSIYISPFIAGGEETDIRIYPFTVSIQYKMRHRCGGVIINKNVVLTAAHCIDDDMTADTNGWEVVAGRSNLLNNEEGQRLKVQSAKIHPNYTYNKTVLLNDIGLIWLKRRFVWSDSVQPANLSQTWNIDLRPFVSYFDSFVVTTIGWGRLQDNGAYPGLLHHVNQTINIGDDCLNTLQREEARSSYGSIMFCTNDKGKEACEGDSGGPVVYNDEVIGIVSHGYGEEKGCEHVVGWKIKVATYYSWIDEELKQAASVSKYPFNDEPKAASTPIPTDNLQEICGVSKIRDLFRFFAWMDGNSINNTYPGRRNNIPSIGGTAALVGGHPWIALIIQDFYPLCGGALITNKHVLTAANCVQLEGAYKVRLGEHNQDDEMDPDVIEIPVEEVIIHPEYTQTRKGFKNDIAILVLTNRVVFTQRIVPICLPYKELKETDLTNSNVILSGWGCLSSGDEYSPILQETNLNIVEQKDCLKVWKGITDQQICAQASGNSLCDGDMGGPLTQLSAENGRYYLLGLVSFALTGKCADDKYPGVFTRITSYLYWIKRNIKNN